MHFSLSFREELVLLTLVKNAVTCRTLGMCDWCLIQHVMIGTICQLAQLYIKPWMKCYLKKNMHFLPCQQLLGFSARLNEWGMTSGTKPRWCLYLLQHSNRSHPLYTCLITGTLSASSQLTLYRPPYDVGTRITFVYLQIKLCLRD